MNKDTDCYNNSTKFLKETTSQLFYEIRRYVSGIKMILFISSSQIKAPCFHSQQASD